MLKPADHLLLPLGSCSVIHFYEQFMIFLMLWSITSYAFLMHKKASLSCTLHYETAQIDVNTDCW